MYDGIGKHKPYHHKIVCCATSCGICGRSACADRSGSAQNCCAYQIRRKGQCGINGRMAPCFIHGISEYFTVKCLMSNQICSSSFLTSIIFFFFILEYELNTTRTTLPNRINQITTFNTTPNQLDSMTYSTTTGWSLVMYNEVKATIVSYV